MFHIIFFISCTTTTQKFDFQNSNDVADPKDAKDTEATKNIDETLPIHDIVSISVSNEIIDDNSEFAPYVAEDLVLERFYVENAEERNAVCNDGSTPIYYYKEGSEENRDKWIVWLQGGAGCGSPEECALREQVKPELMSSELQSGPPQYTFNGIFVDDEYMNPDFHDWTKVFLSYCSSDHWSGNASAEETGDYHFRGHNILLAVIEDLSDANLFPAGTLDEAEEIVIGGNSAASWGLQNNIDRIAQKLPNIPIRGFFDSNFKPVAMLEVELEHGFFDETNVFLEQKINYQKLIPDSSCAESEENILHCFLPYLQQYIETPYFVLMDQYDLLCASYSTVQQLQFFQEAMESSPGCFVPAQNIHVWSNISEFYLLEVQDHTAMDVFGNWYFD